MLHKLPNYSSLKAFTLIELLVVIAIIGVIVVMVIVTLDPVRRLNDAQVSALSAQTAAIGSAYELCLNYINIQSSPAVQNTPADCGYRTDSNPNITTFLSSATPPPPGGPYLKTVPAWGTFIQVPGGGSNPAGCIQGTNGKYWSVYISKNNAVTSGTTGTPVDCPPN